MKFNIALIVIVVSFQIISCKDMDTNEEIIKPYIIKVHENGEKSYYIKLPSTKLIYLNLDNEGNIETILLERDIGLLGLEFYKNGNLKAKVPFISKAKRKGRAYLFYEETGNLSTYFNYVNDKKYGLAQEYYDTTANVKSYMMYNDQEQKIWQKFLNKDGSVLKEEGKMNIKNQ